MCATELLVEFRVGVAERAVEVYANAGRNSSPVLMSCILKRRDWSPVLLARFIHLPTILH